MKINNCSHFVGMSLFCSSPSFTEDEEFFLGANVVKGMWTTLQKIIFPDYFLFFAIV